MHSASTGAATGMLWTSCRLMDANQKRHAWTCSSANRRKGKYTRASICAGQAANEQCKGCGMGRIPASGQVGASSAVRKIVNSRTSGFPDQETNVQGSDSRTLRRSARRSRLRQTKSLVSTKGCQTSPSASRFSAPTYCKSPYNLQAHHLLLDKCLSNHCNIRRKIALTAAGQ